MAVESITRLFTVLGKGEGSWDEMLGTPESGWVEFKSEPYKLNDIRGKLELAKDVSAMANAAPGVIVLGVRTEREATQSRDVATKIHKLPIALLNVDQMKDVLSHYTYPPLTGIECAVHLDAKGDRALLTISVPQQAESERYFIVTDAVTKDGVTKGNMVGVFRREGDRADHLPASYIHELIRAGRRARGFEESSGLPLGALEAVALQLVGLEPAASDAAGAATADEQAELDIEAAELGSETLLLVQAWHGRGFDITGEMHKRGPRGFRTLFEKPPQLRENGFNIDFYGDTEVLPGGGLRNVRTGIASFSVLPSGLCTLAVGRYFLGWATEQRFGKDSEAINPLVIAEFTGEFCRFVGSLVSPLSPEGGSATYQIALLNIDKPGAKRLSPTISEQGVFADAEKPPAGVDSIRSNAVSEQDSEKAAYRLLSSVYANYGVPPDRIPWVDVDSDRLVFDRIGGH